MYGRWCGMELQRELSIIIITKDTRELLDELLESINQDSLLAPYLKEIILVDNASADGTDNLVKSKYPGVFYVRNDSNIGFGAAANKGVSSSKGKYFLLLNSDTRLIEGEISKVYEYMVENQSVGMCGPLLVYHDMRPQRSFAYVPTLLMEIIPKSILEIVYPKKYSVKKHSACMSQTNASGNLCHANKNAFEVESLIGAAIMVQKAAFDKLGGFDERFFFFLEETDLCVRMRINGKIVVFAPDAKIIHHQGKTVGKNWVRGRIEYNISLYKFIEKHHGVLYCTAFMCVRFLKSFFVSALLSVLPFMLADRGIRKRYGYYVRLFLWHLKGCPDKEGLRA